MDSYQQFIAKSRYARYLDDKQRREEWDETVSRYCDYMFGYLDSRNLPLPDYDSIRDNIQRLRVMPSMRALMTSGPALDRCNVGAYNCAYLPVDSLRSFDEAMYVLMCGTGIGFSVEKEYVKQLPKINEHFEQSDTTIVVGDSKAGWARAFRELLALLVGGQIPRWDMSRVRPAGARLNTFGGRASGPEPLERLFEFAVRLFTGASGRKLQPIECHDLMCKVGEVVVSGGVRRSALISLSDLSDQQLSNAKVGYEWYTTEPQRALANNSAVFDSKPSVLDFMQEWSTLIASGSGERGIFNRQAAVKQASISGRRDISHTFGTNPCSEIILRPYQFCNLTEVVCRSDDTLDTLKEKVRVAAILGTYQSMLTDFKYLRKIWKRNSEEERLLGVSLTGIFDCPQLIDNAETWLPEMKQVAIDTNKEYADLWGIQQSAAITCVKPSGTVSQLVGSSEGIHPRWAAYQIRRVRNNSLDPMTQFMVTQGYPAEFSQTRNFETNQIEENPNTTVFSFAKKAPEGAILKDDITAVQHLEIWKKFQDLWCEHKPSATIYVKPDEWMEVGAWVYSNFDSISGVAFLPFFEEDTTFPQLPNETVDQQSYEGLKAQEPELVDWKSFSEGGDLTTSSQELACTGGACDITDFSSDQS